MDKKKISWCTNCLNMSTRPRITFDNRGWCNACQWMEEKQIIDWSKRQNQLNELIDKYKSENGNFDCIVPVSGGKDGSYVAYMLKHKYKMNPLAVTVRPALSLPIGDQNLFNFIFNSIKIINEYLEIKTKMILSSSLNIDHSLKSKHKVIAICKEMNATTYINAIGGVNLYDKDEFLENKIFLNFIKSNSLNYKQFDNEFIPWLSIIDLMMFNSKNRVIELVNSYSII